MNEEDEWMKGGHKPSRIQWQQVWRRRRAVSNAGAEKTNTGSSLDVPALKREKPQMDVVSFVG